ncbi:MAG: SpoIIE family protein phosphatase [Phycisphaerae bacterium]|nr:SpoIIE family protein phosphatase [Phycisphaerae bacterium]
MQDEKLLLLLKERALESAAEGVVIADAGQVGIPIIYVNRAFTVLTGYRPEEVIGRNCRFLQGSDTNPEALKRIRKSLADESLCFEEILNYRKDNTPFWNRLSITPVKGDQGQTTHFIGIQTDVTRRRLAEDSLRDANARLKRDLLAAAELQQDQLPRKLPDCKNYRFAWRFRPCQELAGDTLNVLPLDDRHIAVYVLDVSGHGVRASLQSFSVNHDLQPHQGVLNLLSPEKVLDWLNMKYSQVLQIGMFFTILYGILDTQTGVFTFSSAGHPGPVLTHKDQAPQVIESPSYPIGINPKAEYTLKTMQLQAGEKLIMYTDGVLEAIDVQGNAFGQAGLLETLVRNRELAVDEMLEMIMKSLDNWVSHVNLKDDVSLVGLESV